MTDLKNKYYFSQHDQDRWVNKNIFKNKLNGVFVDIGAFDGKTTSNTYFFEKTLHWKGICIEPQLEIFPYLLRNRNCICVHGGIAQEEKKQDFMRIYTPNDKLSGLSGFVNKYDAKHLEYINNEMSLNDGFYLIHEIQTYNLNNILAYYNIFSIDFLSLDTEGGELDILKSINFDRFKIQVICVENNYNDKNFLLFLTRQGYQKVMHLGRDEIYIYKH